MYTRTTVPHYYTNNEPLTLTRPLQKRGRGGMAAKVDAAMNAISGGVNAVVIADGKDYEAIAAILRGDKTGTLFIHKEQRESGEEEDNSCANTVSISKNLPPPAPATIDNSDTTNSSNSSSTGNSSQDDDPEVKAVAAREGGRALQALSTNERETVLKAIAKSITENRTRILEENAKDVLAAKTCDISPSNEKRLKLTAEKLDVLADGILCLAGQKEPIGSLQSRTELSDGLVLDKLTCPIGVLLIIFESRPDCLPQIAALAIRSGNGLLLKGGKEAQHSCALLHTLIGDAIEAATEGRVSRGCLGLVKSRQDIKKLLSLDAYIDLVIPRGSGSMVKYVQERWCSMRPCTAF